MITPRQLAAIVLVALTVLLGLNFVVFYLEKNSGKQRLIDSLSRPDPIEGIFAGNSLIEIGLSPAVFSASWPAKIPPAAFLNCALGDTLTVEHCVVLRKALRSHPETKLVVYGFAGMQLTDVPDGSWSEVKANRTVSYYLEPKLACQLYGGSDFDLLRFEYIRFLPLVAERYLLWNRVELLRRKLQQIGWCSDTTSRFGRVNDFQSLEKLWSRSVIEEGRSSLDAQVPLTPAVATLIASAREGGNRDIFIVEMPLPPAYEDLVYHTDIWRQYRDYVRTLVERAGGHYIDAHNWVVSPDDFLDSIHLNPSGAALFSTRLAQNLASQVLPSSPSGSPPRGGL